ncbi:hypothetical protein ABID97_001029 [Variovorax sp. OAS795]|uniref:hypothetical protein n=1 Tax=Variovorax sp. OAS795 TaxID=3034231 RepID=UPI003399284C
MRIDALVEIGELAQRVPPVDHPVAVLHQPGEFVREALHLPRDHRARRRVGAAPVKEGAERRRARAAGGTDEAGPAHLAFGR